RARPPRFRRGRRYLRRRLRRLRTAARSRHELRCRALRAQRRSRPLASRRRAPPVRALHRSPRNAGYGSVYLWVLTANERARRFYDTLGGQPPADRSRDADFDGVGVPEVPYVWAPLPIGTGDDRIG